MNYYAEAFKKEQLDDFSHRPPKKYGREQLQLVDRYLTLHQIYDIVILKGEQASPHQLLALQRQLDTRLSLSSLLSVCVKEEGVLSEQQANRHLAFVLVQTKDGVFVIKIRLVTSN